MSQEEWATITAPKKEETYTLSELLHSGCCIRCMNRSCTNNEKHGEKFPEKISVFIKNPSYIKEVDAAIKKANLDFNGITPMYTTCIFTHIHGKCKNCLEGRVKYINVNNKNIELCFPPLDRDKIKNKVTIGIHLDIKLVLNGKHFDVSALPHQCIERVNERITERITERINERITERITEPVQEHAQNLVNESVNESVKESFNELVDVYEDEFPTINNNASPSNKSILDFSKIKKTTEIEEKEAKLKESLLKEEAKLKEDAKLKEEAKLKAEDKLKAEALKLSESEEVCFLNKRITELIIENKHLKDENDKIVFMNKNIAKYREMLINLKNLSTIEQQFLDTEYSSYKVIY